MSHAYGAAQRSGALNFRAPSTAQQNSKDFSSFTHIPKSWLLGTWHVTHSTLSMWRNNRNVRITYRSLGPSLESLSTNGSEKLDDLVEYQPLHSDKLKTVTGIDTADADVQDAYNWRGKGWLKIASSHWEVIGWGEEDDGWCVTWFSKTLFTSAGIDIYARRREGLSEGLLTQIKSTLSVIGDSVCADLAKEMFTIRHDSHDDLREVEKESST